MRSVIEVNPLCSYDEVEVETLLSLNTIFNIILNRLKLKKVTLRWLPHQLIHQQNSQDRLRICQENFIKIKVEKGRLYDVLTGDEP